MNEVQNQTPVKKKGCLSGCLTIFAIFFVICAIVGVIVSLTMDKVKTGIAQYIDVSNEQGATIDKVLADCGIEKLKSAKHDELLDNAHKKGETGYRLSVNGVDNIILYLNPDKSVYSLRYADYDLYTDGSVSATLNDYCMTVDEMSKWQSLCQDKVKEVLKNPKTANFPNVTKWKFEKNKNIITIQSYVDAKNSFGSELRSEYQFIIDSDSQTIQSFILDGQEMISQ